MRGRAVVLLIARPGRIREAWRALLLSTREIGAVQEAADVTSARAALEGHSCDIVLIDVEALGTEMEALVHEIRAKQPACHCIVLVRSERQAQQARELGVDEVLIKGLPAAQFFAAVERALARPAAVTDQAEPA